MSFDPYHFHMVIRQQEVARAERIAADVQIGRFAQGAWRLGCVAARAGRALRRAVSPDPRPWRARMQPRRDP